MNDNWRWVRWHALLSQASCVIPPVIHQSDELAKHQGTIGSHVLHLEKFTVTFTFCVYFPPPKEILWYLRAHSSDQWDPRGTPPKFIRSFVKGDHPKRKSLFQPSFGIGAMIPMEGAMIPMEGATIPMDLCFTKDGMFEAHCIKQVRREASRCLGYLMEIPPAATIMSSYENREVSLAEKW